MSKLTELRMRSKQSKELQINRIRSAVTDVVNSSAFTLTALNHLDETESEEQKREFVETVSEKITAATCDARVEFLDICKNRGLTERKIKKAVTQINSLFNLTTSEDEDEQMEAVALYLQQNQWLWEDIALLT